MEAAGSEWQALSEQFRLDKSSSSKSRTEILTEEKAVQKPDLVRDVRSFGLSVVNDITVVLQNTELDWKERSGRLWDVVTFGDRGVILGVILVIISLSVMALMPPVQTSAPVQTTGPVELHRK